jgi:hypothetical protein
MQSQSGRETSGSLYSTLTACQVGGFQIQGRSRCSLRLRIYGRIDSTHGPKVPLVLVITGKYQTPIFRQSRVNLELRKPSYDLISRSRRFVLLPISQAKEIEDHSTVYTSQSRAAEHPEAPDVGHISRPE